MTKTFTQAVAFALSALVTAAIFAGVGHLADNQYATAESVVLAMQGSGSVGA